MVKWTSELFYYRLFVFSLLTILFSVIFGSIYYGLYYNKVDDFGYKNDDGSSDWSALDSGVIKPFDFWYFSWITQTTVGYGDISPKSNEGRVLACVQIFLFWIVALTFAVLADEKDMSCILVPWKKCK